MRARGQSGPCGIVPDMSRVVIAAIVLLVAAHFVLTLQEHTGGSAGTTWSGPPLPVERRVEDWYGVYVLGTKAGHSVRIAEPAWVDGEARVRTIERGTYRRQVGGVEREVRTSTEVHYGAEPPHRVVWAASEARSGADVRRVELTGGPPSYRAHITEDGRTRTMKYDYEPPTWTERDEPRAWFCERRRVGDALTHGVFDFNSLHWDYRTLRITGIQVGAGGGAVPPVCTVSYGTRYGSGKGVLRIDAAGTVLSETHLGDVEWRLEPRHQACLPGSAVEDLFSLYLPVNRPLGDPHKVVELVLELSGPGVERIRDAPHLSATYDTARDVMTLKLGKAHDPGIRMTELERVYMQQPSARYPTEDPAVQALAMRAIGSAKSPREKVRRLVAFVEGYLEYSSGAEPLSVPDILRRRKGVCWHHALLFTTLARAAGLPARTAVGLAYAGDGQGPGGTHVFSAHAWNEVVLDGVWVAVDPTWGQVEVDATHIRLRSGLVTALSGTRLRCVRIRTKSR